MHLNLVNESRENIINDFSIPLISTDFKSAVNKILFSLYENRKVIFFHSNVYNYFLLNRRVKLPEKLINSCYFFFDGIGMKLGSWFLGRHVKNDLNGTDMYPLLFNELSQKDISIFLLGGKQNVIENTFINLMKNFPKINILGVNSGYFNQESETELIDKINKLQPDLLIVGMGFVREADFIIRNYDKLNFKAIWNVGGLFDFISGKYKRAPKLLLKFRLEWLYRFMQAPVQKFERTFIVPFWFFFKLLKLNFSTKKIKGSLDV